MLLFCNEAEGIKAEANIVKYRQPDGSIVTLKLYGDEFYGYIKRVTGDFVTMGPDRFISPINGQGTQFLHYSKLREMGRSHLVRGVQKPFSGVSGTGRIPRTRSNMVEMQQIESLVILVEFADVKFTIENPKEYFASMLNSPVHYENGATGSAAAYLKDNFGAGYDFSFKVEGVFALSGKLESYGARTEFLNDIDPARMVREACETAASNGVDFSLYDHDKDGTADNVAIIFAGYNEAESGDANAIWPHYGNISNENVVLSGVKIEGYSCSSEYTGGNTEQKAATIGTFLHEFCHYLGLPDMYDVNGVVEGLSNALYGSLSIMDAGNFLNDGNTPPCFTSIEREILSLGEIEELVPGDDYTLLPLPSASRIYRINSQNEGEYFLFECRKEEGWDTYIGGSGLVVYHIDKSQSNVAGLKAVTRWEHNIINAYAEHECAGVLTASNTKSSVEGNRITSGIFFPGETSKTKLSYNTLPALRDWSGGGIGTSLEDITFTNGRVTFKAVEDVALCDTLPYATDISVLPYQKGVMIEWKSSVYNADKSVALLSNPGGAWVVVLSDMQSGRVLYESGTTSTYMAVSGLLPDNEYNISIHYGSQNLMGRREVSRTKTLPVNSSFPYIVVKEEYRVDDVLHIDVQNLHAGVNGSTVKIDGKRMLDEYYTFKEPGEYHIEVSIPLPDGSIEVINKLIKVEPR